MTVVDAAGSRVDRLASGLTMKRRLHAAWMAAVIWGVWAVTVLQGNGVLDAFGQVIGADYLEFYAAGRALARGAGARLYDLAYMRELELAIAGPGLGRYHAFITPPFLAAIFLPFASLPYFWSYTLWSVFGLGALYASLLAVRATPHGRMLLWTLTFFPVFATFSYGQTTFLTLAILGVVYRFWERGRMLGAGLICSLALFKPHLVIGLVIVALARRKEGLRFLVGLGGGASLIATASWWLMPEASRAYAVFAREVLPGLPTWLDFPLWNLHTIRGFWRLVVPWGPTLADGLALATTAVVVIAFLRARHHLNRRLQFGSAVVLSLVCSPHAMVYDWALLVIPAVLLWRDRPDLGPRWRVVFALVWLVTLVSGPLVLAQQRLISGAVQVSVPALLAAGVLSLRWLTVSPAAASPASLR